MEMKRLATAHLFPRPAQGLFLLLAGLSAVPVFAQTPTFTTTPCCISDKVLGTGSGGGVSQFASPLGICISSSHVYIADAGNGRVDVYDKNGNLASAPITAAGFSVPQGLALDSLNHLYVANWGGNTVYKMDLGTNGVVTTFSGLGGSMPSPMNGPIGVWADSQGTTVVVVENLSGRRVRIFRQQGDGSYIPVQQLVPNAAATNFTPVGVTADPSGNLYVTDDDFSSELCIWMYAAPSYSFSVKVADNSAGHLWDPRYISMDSAGNFYVGNRGTIAPGGLASISVFKPDWTFLYSCMGDQNKTFFMPQGVAVDEVGRVYVTDENNDRVVRLAPCPLVTLPTPTFTATLSPSFTPTFTPTRTPSFTPTFTRTFTPSFTPTFTVSVTPVLTPTNTPDPCCTSSKILGSGVQGNGPADLSFPQDLKVGPNNIYISNGNRVDVYSKAGDPASRITNFSGVTLTFPIGLALDSLNHLFIVDNGLVRKLDLSSNTLLTTIDGLGGVGPALNTPMGVWSNAQGTTVVVTENTGGKRARVYQRQGNGSYIPIQQLNPSCLPVPGNFTPVGVTADAAGNLYVTDDNETLGDFYILKFDAPGYTTCSIVASASTGLVAPRFITTDPLGNFYVAEADQTNLTANALRVYRPDWTLLRQCDGPQGAGGGVTFNGPEGVGVDELGRVYVSDEYNARVVRFDACPGLVFPTPTFTPVPTATPAGCGETLATYCYPNPVEGNSAKVFCNLCEPGPLEVNLYNVAAELVLSQSFQGSAGGNTFTLDVSSLSHGVYYYLIRAQGASGPKRSKTIPIAVIRP